MLLLEQEDLLSAYFCYKEQFIVFDHLLQSTFYHSQMNRILIVVTVIITGRGIKVANRVFACAFCDVIQRAHKDC